MTLYFLNQRLGSEYIADKEGAEFETIEDARHEAIAAAREQIAKTVLEGRLDLTGAFEITCGGGDILIVRFSEAVTLALAEGLTGIEPNPSPRGIT
jgi:hypothetical protein